MSHIEKDKHDFEPSIDTVANVPDRIIDTIPILMDSVPADTVPPFIMDTIMLPDTVQIPTDTLTPHDSLRHDTLTHEKPIPLKPQRSASAIETQVICSAADSVYRDVKQKKIYTIIWQERGSLDFTTLILNRFMGT